ncbi:MAG TPA: hypothetical protein PK306_11990 [Aquabacterium sp.]|nr:hypothetical protein [Aquabacterium sp.]
MQDELEGRLRMATPSDLVDLCADLKLSSAELEGLGNNAKYRRIADELRAVAGHKVMNLARSVRSRQLSYREILVDVADKLTRGVFRRSGFHARPDADVATIEDYIVKEFQRVTAARLQKMSPDERRQVQSEIERRLGEKGVPAAVMKAASAALAAGSISGLALASAASGAFYSGLWTALFGLSMRQLVLSGLAVGGPVGIVAGIAMLLTSPSYGKTRRAVVRLAFIRRSHDEREALMKDVA